MTIEEKIGYSLGLFEGQSLFGSSEKGTGRLFLSTIRLNPHVHYFRIFMDDVRGALSNITKLFADNSINILSGGGFGFGKIWVSEFIADFKGIEISPEKIVEGIESFGAFVTSREITELFPKSFNLDETYKIKRRGEELYISLKELPIEVTSNEPVHAILKSWPRIQALFIDFYTPENRLVRINARIKDVPGSFDKLAKFIASQVDSHAYSEQHHDENSGEWTIYGSLVLGEIDELLERSKEIDTIVGFDVKPMGWKR
ncbi:MAG: hypothetical protein ACLFVP_00745 [Candidatus Bathyarchaeia archaeon]